MPSKGDDFSCYSNNEDHFTVKMAPPAKRRKTNDGGRVHRKACKVIAKSDDEDDAKVDNAFLVGVDELLKGDDIDPLAFD